MYSVTLFDPLWFGGPMQTTDARYKGPILHCCLLAEQLSFLCVLVSFVKWSVLTHSSIMRSQWENSFKAFKANAWGMLNTTYLIDCYYTMVEYHQKPRTVTGDYFGDTKQRKACSSYFIQILFSSKSLPNDNWETAKCFVFLMLHVKALQGTWSQQIICVYTYMYVKALHCFKYKYYTYLYVYKIHIYLHMKTGFAIVSNTIYLAQNFSW